VPSAIPIIVIRVQSYPSYGFSTYGASDLFPEVAALASELGS
jgi:hypothetical protein